MTDELLDAFDDSLRPLGPRPRDEVHRDGLWHHVFHCLVVRTSPPARVLLQRRSASARSFAGLLDLTATGHLLTGEEPRDGVRELHEEVGLLAEPGDLVALGTWLMADRAGEGHNREIVHVFLLPSDRPLRQFEFADLAVDGIVEIEVDALRTVLAGGHVDAVEVDRSGHVQAIRISPDDLVASADHVLGQDRSGLRNESDPDAESSPWATVAELAARFVDERVPPQ